MKLSRIVRVRCPEVLGDLWATVDLGRVQVLPLHNSSSLREGFIRGNLLQALSAS